MTNIDDFISFCDNMKITNEHSISTNHLSISCFAGVGKDYAMNVLSSKYKVDSIEKYRDFYEIYPTRDDYMNDIKRRSMLNDVLFIPYFLGMNPRYIDNSINYILVYPDKKYKSEFINRFKQLGFTPDQIKYLKDNFNDMIDDCDNQKIPSKNKYKINKDEYCLNIINKLL